ncbi:MAG: ABC transporter ATP-binding protein [Deltaproteobacteria bacterium]|nr:ABC transporter ATP-binding protein [Deltaproteobacteria bacterium]
MSREILSVQSVAYAYTGNGWRLQPASFVVRPGDILGIIGPNGSGKSTLLKLAAGVLPSQKGTVRLLEQDIRRLKRREIARTLGYLPQRVESHVGYTVQEIVAMGRFAHLRGGGFLCTHDMEVVSRCLELTDIVPLRQRRLSRLSGGERQRVLLASVIAQEPQVLLLDEPTTALDIHHQMRVFDILVELAQKGMGVVVVTHDLNLASVFCEQVLLLQEGAVMHRGKPEDILTKEILEDVYGNGLETMIHPITGRPVVVPAASGRSGQTGAS